MAKRWLVEICAVSDSIWEKSGLSVASSAVCSFGVYLMSMPPSPLAGRLMRLLLSLLLPSLRSVPFSLAVTYGAATMCPPVGSPSKPPTLLELQTKQLFPRGSLWSKIW